MVELTPDDLMIPKMFSIASGRKLQQATLLVSATSQFSAQGLAQHFLKNFLATVLLRVHKMPMTKNYFKILNCKHIWSQKSAINIDDPLMVKPIFSKFSFSTDFGKSTICIPRKH